MIRSRALVLSLLIAIVLVVALGPVALFTAIDAEEQARTLTGDVAAARTAVDDAVGASNALLDTLEGSMQSDAQAEASVQPGAIQRLLDLMDVEEEAFDLAARTLDDVGVGALDDRAAASREEVLRIVARFGDVVLSGETPADIDDLVAEAQTAYAAFREDLAGLDRAVEAEVVQPASTAIGSSTSRIRLLIILGGGVLLVFLLGALVVVLRTTRRTTIEAARIEAERTLALERNEFESSLMRGLEMARTEPAVFAVVRQAVSEQMPGAKGELLAADSSIAHFHRVLSVGDMESGCSVTSPLDCPAATRGQAQVFPDDSALDTCPFLRGRGCSATCVPVSVAGKTSGVVHMTGAIGTPPQGEVLVTLETISRRSAERIAMVRAFEQTTAQAMSDSLTGLPNRRALEGKLHEQHRSPQGYALAFCDLDRFKDLNDRHGHATGDRALRLFADVLRDAVRPSDLPSRYGGEEFVLVLPGCPPDEAVDVMERIRERLAAALSSGEVPAFTCSFGLAQSTDGDDPESVIAAADAALLQAKAAGRDRVVRYEVPRPRPGLAPAPPAA